VYRRRLDDRARRGRQRVEALARIQLRDRAGAGVTARDALDRGEVRADRFRIELRPECSEPTLVERGPRGDEAERPGEHHDANVHLLPALDPGHEPVDRV
jgi:hypothetical protein